MVIETTPRCQMTKDLFITRLTLFYLEVPVQVVLVVDFTAIWGKNQTFTDV